MKRTTRMLSLVLALLMLLPMLASCKDEGGKGKETKNDDPENTVYEGENGYVLAVNNYNGAAFTISYDGWGSLDASEETGDTLNDSIFRRNSKVESLYNIDLDVVRYAGEPSEYITQTSAVILSGMDSYQLIGSKTGGMATHVMSTGYYQNLLDLPYFDFDQKWWPTEFMKNAKIGNNLFMAIGMMDQTYYDHFTAFLFNKQMALDTNTGDLYQLVRDGGWTLDKLIEFADRAKVDLDGNGIMEAAFDRFGFTVHRAYPTHAFVTSFDVQTTGVDAEGMPYILPLTEHYVDVGDKLDKFFHSNSVNYRSRQEDGPADDTSFLEGRALFEANRMCFATDYRAMENDFGILPYPKWDENQERYISYSDTDQASAFAIPVTTNGDFAANIFEAMSYFGDMMVLPAYYDKVLKGRLVRDEQSSEMLDIIYDNVSYQFVQVYSEFLDPSPTSLLASALRNGTKLAREYNSNQRKWELRMKQLIEKLDIDGVE